MNPPENAGKTSSNDILATGGWADPCACGEDAAVAYTKAGRRKDAYLCELDRGASEPAREDVYAEWLREKLAPACALERVEVCGFKLARVRRSQHKPGEEKSKPGITIPDVNFAGILRVTDPDAFARLLAEGFGTQRGFGFGALFLRPARAAAQPAPARRAA